MTHWFPRHPAFRVLMVATAASFLTGLLFEDLRPNLIAEMWGVVGAGIVIWWVLEQHSEQIQTRAWIERNVEYAIPLVNQIQGTLMEPLLVSLGAPAETVSALAYGRSMEARQRAADAIRATNIADLPIVDLPNTYTRPDAFGAWEELAPELDELKRIVQDNAPIIDRLLPLRIAFADVTTAYGDYMRLTGASNDPQEDDYRRARGYLWGVGLSCVGLSLAASEILVTMGRLPRKDAQHKRASVPWK